MNSIHILQHYRISVDNDYSFINLFFTLHLYICIRRIEKNFLLCPSIIRLVFQAHIKFTATIVYDLLDKEREMTRRNRRTFFYFCSEVEECRWIILKKEEREREDKILTWSHINISQPFLLCVNNVWNYFYPRRKRMQRKQRWEGFFVLQEVGSLVSL